VRRTEPHIYVANWFYLSFIITVAMLHLINNLAIPVSFLGTRSISYFAACRGRWSSGGMATMPWASS
jgi:cytochrome c oxidase cbb3-type subunit 1